jgi:hypothetical protein
VSALWQPYWKASTAYAVTAVVIPTTFAGYTWRCTTAGTSGNSEPSWPADPSTTPTIADGGVTWTVGTGFRQALQSGVSSIVTTFAAANPTIIRSIRTVRPLNFANVELPCFFIGDMSESITHSQGIRTRMFDGFSGFLVDAPGSVDESNDRMNFAADVLTDLFTANPHAASGRSIFQHVATLDTQEQDANGANTYPALEFRFAEAVVAEGRT